jgi:hypothetical protein
VGRNWGFRDGARNGEGGSARHNLEEMSMSARRKATPYRHKNTATSEPHTCRAFECAGFADLIDNPTMPGAEEPPRHPERTEWDSFATEVCGPNARVYGDGSSFDERGPWRNRGSFWVQLPCKQSTFFRIQRRDVSDVVAQFSRTLKFTCNGNCSEVRGKLVDTLIRYREKASKEPGSDNGGF